MKKLSQRELLVEGFGTNLLKQLARGAGQVATTVAKAISPTAVKVAAAAADKVGSALQNTFASPAESIKDYFRKPEVKSKYTGLQILNTKKGSNRMSQIINIKVTEVATNKELTASIEAYRTDKGGISKEEWSIKKIKFSNGEEVVVGEPSPNPKPEETGKIKFYDELRDWKIKTIGPKAASVGINGHQLKEFLQSLGVEDPDRIIADQAGLDRIKYGTIVSNKQIATIETVLKSRGIVTESKKSQKSLLKHLQSMSR